MGSWASAITRTGRMPAFLVAGGCLVLLYGFLMSGDYDVDDVTVRGAILGDPRDVAGSTGAFGESVFRVEPDEIAERLAGLSYVQQVDVETQLPSRVVVTLVEREPAVVWMRGTQSFLVDAHGQVMLAGDVDGLPRVTGEDVGLAVGENIKAERVAAVTAAAGAFADDIDEMTWSDREGLSVRLQDKRLVILGEPERLPLKLAVYQEFGTADLVWSVLDLREPDRPYYE